MTAAQTVGDIDKLNELKEEEAEKAKSKCVLKLLLKKKKSLCQTRLHFQCLNFRRAIFCSGKIVSRDKI
jgi:hypothetical protein